MLDVLDRLGATDEERDSLREDAEDILDAVDADVPDEDRLRARGRSIAGVLGRIGTAATGGTIAQLLGPAVLAALAG